MYVLRKVTGKTVSRKDATAQRKTFLYFEKRLWNVGINSMRQAIRAGKSLQACGRLRFLNLYPFILLTAGQYASSRFIAQKLSIAAR